MLDQHESAERRELLRRLEDGTAEPADIDRLLQLEQIAEVRRLWIAKDDHE